MQCFQIAVRHPCRMADRKVATGTGHSRCPPADPVYLFLQVTLILLLVVSESAVQAAPDQNLSTAVLSVGDAVAIAVESNPGLAEVQARAEAMAAIPSQAGALPDPIVSLGALSLPTDSFSLDQEAMTQMQIGIEQSLPFPGKRELKERAAEFEAGAASSNVDESRLRLVYNVKNTWWQIFYIDRALEIVSRNRDLLRQFVEIAQTKYKVGEGLQQEVLLAQVELSRLIDRRIQLLGQRRQQVARLNALLDWSPDTTLVLPETVNEDISGILPEQQLYSRAEASRPLLVQRRQEVEAARTRRDFARRDRYPDFTLGAAYGFRQGENPDGGSRPDFATIRLGVSLPVYASRKQHKAVDQRTSELLEKRYALQDETSRVKADIAAALADYQRAGEQVKLFKTGIIPQARQSVASMFSGYQVNKVDFLNLVRAQVTLYSYETRYWRSFSDARQALASLTAAVGEEVAGE